MMWTSDITSIVFTQIKAIGNKKLRTKYPNINFTTSSKVPTDSKFPTVYVKRMQGAEKGQDLEGINVNAILCSFQIEVTTNTNDTQAQEIADVVYSIMKSMRFQVLGEPFADNTQDGVYRNVARYQRIIGNGEIL